MYSKIITIINKTGLHARPAAEFCKVASSHQSQINVKRLGTDVNKEGNGKSVISVMAMGLTKGSQVEICAEGGDEVKAVDTLCALVESGFGEI